MPEPASTVMITALTATIRAFGWAATAASRAVAGSGSQEMTTRAVASPGRREMMRAGPRPGSRPMMTRAVAGPGSREMMARAVAWPVSRPAMRTIGWAAARVPSKDERAVVGLLCRPALTMPLPHLWPSPGDAPARLIQGTRVVAITMSNQYSDVSYSLSRWRPA